jgi:glycosyltransferase involved in cell wall biosynthesis
MTGGAPLGDRPAPRLLMFVNDAAFFLSHRLPVALAARDAGFDVHIATAPGQAVDTVRKRGFVHHTIPLTRSGMNLLEEARALLAVWRLLRQLRPQILHCVTIKPVIYGGLMARLSRVPAVVGAVSGLGFVFLSGGAIARLRRAIVRVLYRLALDRENVTIIVQNPDDARQMRAMLGAQPHRAVLIRGSGVDIARYRAVPRAEGTPAIVVMASRLLVDKGVREFVSAARSLRAAGLPVIFRLAGDVDPNPASVPGTELESWRREGVVEMVGYQRDVAALFANCDLVVLPSYREGLPKVLLEAAACGRAVVTTDVPGCRDAIQPGTTGLLVPARDATALAAAIKRLITDRELRLRMGAAGRALAEREFAIESVIDAHLSVYREACAAA